jgi:hypothetical protein
MAECGLHSITEPRIAAVEQKLDETLAKLKQCKDPDTRRNLLAEMRTLIAELTAMFWPPRDRIRSSQI